MIKELHPCLYCTKSSHAISVVAYLPEHLPISSIHFFYNPLYFPFPKITNTDFLLLVYSQSICYSPFAFLNLSYRILCCVFFPIQHAFSLTICLFIVPWAQVKQVWSNNSLFSLSCWRCPQFMGTANEIKSFFWRNACGEIHLHTGRPIRAPEELDLGRRWHADTNDTSVEKFSFICSSWHYL